MKRFLKVLIIVLLILVIVLTAAFFALKSMKQPEVNVGEIKLESIKDGSYKGEYSAGLVSAAVTVAIKDKRIADIIIDKHDNGLGKKAEKIVDEIIGKQSLAVDIVSGATLSSNVIRKAVEEALKQ